MAEYSRLASGQVTSTGGNTAVILPFLPTFIEISNSTRAVAASGVTRAWWERDMGQGAAFVVTTGSGPADGTSFISASTGGGFSTFQGGIALQYGAQKQIIGATAANPIVFNVTAHGYVVGNVVTFQGLFQSATTGMPQIAGIPFVVSAVGDADHFSVVWPGSGGNYTALSGSPTGAFVKQILYPNLYAPGVSFIEAITTGATTTVVTTAPNNFVVGQQIAFRIPSAWGTSQLNSLPNILIPGSPNYGFVTSVTNSTTFVCNINSTGYTAFNTNQTVASVLAGGFNFPQVLAVGDANSGSLLTNFIAPSFYNGRSSSAVQSINGPAIAGAYCNNTSMGFIIGASVSGSSSDSIFWNAYMMDYNA
jgi:hypothetical protein